MTGREAQTVGVLLERTWWREGEMSDRLREVERVANARARGQRYTDDPKLDARIAKLARAVRKAM